MHSNVPNIPDVNDESTHRLERSTFLFFKNECLLLLIDIERLIHIKLFINLSFFFCFFHDCNCEKNGMKA